MKRTTIFIPETLDADLRSFARREKKPVAWVVREAVSQFLETNRPEWKMPSFVGIGASGYTDTADRFEELLFEGMTPHDDRVPTPKKPSKRPSRSRKRRR